MAFTEQEGTDGVADANAATTVAFVDDYHEDRGNTAWTGTSAAKEQAIIRATDYLERVWAPYLNGFLVDTDVERFVSFPRTSLYDRNWVLQEEVPTKWQQATAEYALRALTAGPEDGLYPDATDDDALTRERKKVGPIETEREWSEFVDTGDMPSYPLADALVQEFLSGGPGVGRSHRA
jgi:hypothetical protein